jgi:hypothetical protein
VVETIDDDDTVSQENPTHRQLDPLDFDLDLDGWGKAAVTDLYFSLVRTGDVLGLQNLVCRIGAIVFPWCVVDDYLCNATHIACEANQRAMLQYLLQTGNFSLTATNNHRDTCLHIAMMHGHQDIVKNVLLPAFDGNLLSQNAQKWTPLDVACFFGQVGYIDRVPIQRR